MRPRLRHVTGRFAVCRLRPAAPVPRWAHAAGSLVVVARTPHELSIVCPDEAVPTAVRAERGFRALVVCGPLPFDAVGIMAGITGVLAAREIPLLAISTFDTDYVLVRETEVGAAVEALRAAGYDVAA